MEKEDCFKILTNCCWCRWCHSGEGF